MRFSADDRQCPSDGCAKEQSVTSKDRPLLPCIGTNIIRVISARKKAFVVRCESPYTWEDVFLSIKKVPSPAIIISVNFYFDGKDVKGHIDLTNQPDWE